MDGKAGNQKGAELERRVSRIEFADGAIVRMRWPVVHQISGRRRTITDVDALVLDFDARLRPLLGIIECKSTRGQAGEQDRLLWLAGLRRFVGANRAVLVRESVTAAGRDLSRRLGVELLGLRELEQRELDHQWVPETFGVIGDGPYSEAMQKAEAQIKGIGDLPSGLVSFHRYDALVAEPHRVLGSLMSLGDITQAGTILPEPAGTIVAADALTALILAALRAGGKFDALGEEGMRREIEDGLATGDPHDRSVLKIVELADAVLREQLSRVHRAYVEHGARPIEMGFASIRDAVTAAPAWLPRFYDLAIRCRRRPTVAVHLPQVADLVLYDALLGGESWRAPAFDHLFTPEHRQLLLVAFDVLAAAAPHLAERIRNVPDMPFDRTQPAVPDRHATPPPDRRGAAHGPAESSRPGSQANLF